MQLLLVAIMIVSITHMVWIADLRCTFGNSPPLCLFGFQEKLKYLNGKTSTSDMY